jgi:hypothetical protein
VLRGLLLGALKSPVQGLFGLPVGPGPVQGSLRGPVLGAVQDRQRRAVLWPIKGLGLGSLGGGPVQGLF